MFTLSYSRIEDGDSGTGVIHDDPLFVSGYYLDDGSPCTNTGTGQSSVLGLDERYSQGAAKDSGTMDMGYHYPEAFGPDPAELYVDATRPDNTGREPIGPRRTGTLPMDFRRRTSARRSTWQQVHTIPVWVRAFL